MPKKSTRKRPSKKTMPRKADAPPKAKPKGRRPKKERKTY